MHTKYPLLSCVSVVAALSLQGAYASEIGFSVRQDTVDSGVRIMVSPNDKVRSGDRLIIVDEGINENVDLYAVPFSDVNSDGTPDNVEIQIPFGSQHALLVDVAPVDAQTGTIYCGLSAGSWRGDFAGTGTEDIKVSGAQKVGFDEACPNGYFDSGVILRVDHAHIVAEAPKRDIVAGDVVLSSFVCREITNNPFGDCSKRQVARENAKASLVLQDVVSNCSVTAQVVYAEERGRMIVSKEDAIRFAGYCPSGYTGVNFSYPAIHDSRLLTTMKGIPLPSSVKKWVLEKVAKAFGKKAAKQIDKWLSDCDTSRLSWGQTLANFVLSILGLNACPAGG